MRIVAILTVFVAVAASAAAAAVSMTNFVEEEVIAGNSDDSPIWRWAPASDDGKCS